MLRLVRDEPRSVNEIAQHFDIPIVRWMGDYAVLDPRPGGEFTLDINGVPVRGRYLELDPPRRLLISWGHAGSEKAGRRWIRHRVRPPAVSPRGRGTRVAAGAGGDEAFEKVWPAEGVLGCLGVWQVAVQDIHGGAWLGGEGDLDGACTGREA